MLVGKALSFTHELSFFLFYQSTALSSRAVDGHWMYSTGSVVGKASTLGKEVSPTPPTFSQRVIKCEIWRRFQHHSISSRPRLKMQQDIRTLKQTSYVVLIALCARQVSYVWSTHIWEPLDNSTPSLKLHGENVLNRK